MYWTVDSEKCSASWGGELKCDSMTETQRKRACAREKEDARRENTHAQESASEREEETQRKRKPKREGEIDALVHEKNHLSILRNNNDSVPPDPINYLCSLTGVCISQKYFTSRWVQIFQILFQGWFYAKSCSKDFTLQDLILRTRLCGTGFISRCISQRCWIVDFYLNKMVRRKFFVPGLYQLRKGKLAGMAPKYFYNDS